MTDYKLNIEASKYVYSSLLHQLNDSVLDNYRNPINETFLACQYNMEACSGIEFRFVFLEYLGFCIRITTDSKITKAGILNGLALQMVIDPPNKQNRFVDKRGMRVFIHNKSEDADFNEGFEIGTGQSFNVEVKRTFNKQFPAPNSKCLLETSESKGFNFVNQFNRSYTQR